MTFCETRSKRTDWETPDYIFKPLHAEFGFQRDVCANFDNRKVIDYWNECRDGLSYKWSGMLWMNPPYGPEIGAWVKKAYDSACNGSATVVALLPVRSSNEWWKYVIAAEVRFVRKKIRFVGAPFNSMFPNAIVIWHAHLDPGGIMKVWEPKQP